MKRVLIVLSMIFILVGCSNQEEQKKEVYTDIKKELLNKEKFTDINDIPFNITTNVKRTSLEQIKYEVLIDTPSIEMKNIKVLVLHNYQTTEIFPSIGIFEDAPSLEVGTDKNVKVEGYIDTSYDIIDLNLIIKIYVEYTDQDNIIHHVYYQSTKYE